MILKDYTDYDTLMIKYFTRFLIKIIKIQIAINLSQIYE